MIMLEEITVCELLYLYEVHNEQRYLYGHNSEYIEMFIIMKC